MLLNTHVFNGKIINDILEELASSIIRVSAVQANYLQIDMAPHLMKTSFHMSDFNSVIK